QRWPSERPDRERESHGRERDRDWRERPERLRRAATAARRRLRRDLCTSEGSRPGSGPESTRSCTGRSCRPGRRPIWNLVLRPPSEFPTRAEARPREARRAPFFQFPASYTAWTTPSWLLRLPDVSRAT